MAYIPPHMRHAKGGAASSSLSPALPPESVIPRFQRKLNISPKNHAFRIVYGENAISGWFVVGLADESRVFDLARLEPVAMDYFDPISSEKPLVLVLGENGDEAGELSENPWIFVAEKVKEDLFSSFQQVKDDMKGYELGEIKAMLVLRFGKIFFHGNRSFTAESMKGRSLPIDTLKRLQRSLYTDIPASYVDYITSEVIPKIEFEFEEEKDLYRVKLSDSTEPDLTIMCKCTIAKDTNQLELRRIESNQVRHLVANMSCLDKNLDMRLMLYTKRTVVSSTDEGLENIKRLISSARVDSEVKGGLRWPLGKLSSGDRYTVIGAWHTNAKTFRNSSMRLKIQHADRFDFRTSHGEVNTEVSLKMPGIVSLLQEQNVDTDLALEMLRDNLKLIWMHFLSCDSFT